MTSVNKHIVSGRIGKKPELRYTVGGTAVCSFSIARQPRHLNKATNQWEDGEVTWYSVTAWNRLAENVANSLDSGQEVTVIGDVSLRNYEDNSGKARTSLELKADDVTVSLDHQVIQVTDKSAYGNSKGGGGQAPARPVTTSVDNDETPF